MGLGLIGCLGLGLGDILGEATGLGLNGWGGVLVLLVRKLVFITSELVLLDLLRMAKIKK